MLKSDVIAWGIKDMIEAFGCSRPEVGNKVVDGIFVKIKKGEYDSVRSVANWRRKKQEEEKPKSATEERARLDRLRADKIEMENAVIRKELVSLPLAQERYIANNHAIRQKLLTIPSKAAPVLVGKTAPEIQSALIGFLNEAFKDISDPDFVKMIDEIL